MEITESDPTINFSHAPIFHELKATFSSTFDKNLMTVLLPYLDFNDFLAGLYKVNKNFGWLFREDNEYFWKLYFTQEFI